jgi:hypothetical protein
VFERSEKWATYVKLLEQIKPIDGIGSQSYMDVGDTSISIELGALIDDIVSWSQEVSEQRSDYLFNNMVTELPDPYWMAFGLTSDVVKRYESLTGRMKRLIECLKQVSPRGAKIPELAQVHHSLEKSFNEKERTAPISKQEIIRLIGCGETKFRRIKKEGMYGLQDVPKTRDVTLWKEDYERLKNK